MKTLLIANRGEIARRIIRTARAMGLRTVAVYSDADAAMPFVGEADVAVRLGGNSPAESYLRADALLDAARRTGADAIHPGYGFLAESSSFARACADAGVTFVGPTPDAIDAMGSKIGAKARLRDAGVPVLPDADVTGLDGAELRAAADGVGYPLLVKPSAGGGGKGMQVVASADEIEPAVAAARRLAKDAFGDDSMLLERFVERGRHVEIQILGDTHGTVVHLGERECSVQRRHQKVLEESPSVAVSSELRERMGSAAVAAGEAIGYVGAGTVEFLLGADDEFFFLEVNTRLQVEHPVTEEVTGVDLVREQLQIAAGASIGDRAREVAFTGHAIEVRLYAEDPAQDFLPQTGVLHRLAFPAGRPGLRVDAGVESGSEVSIYYDPMIAKVITHAPTREEAARSLAAALRETHIDGLRTNRDFLVRLLEDERFLAGEIDTRFLDREESASLRAALATDADVRLAAAAAALSRQAAERASATVQRTIPTGWRNSPSQDQLVEYDAGGDAPLQVTYRFGRDGLTRLAVDGEPLGPLRLLHATPDEVVLELDGVRHALSVRRDPGGPTHVSGAFGQVDLVEQPRYLDPNAQEAPGSLLAPMPGSVIRVDVAVGDDVTAGTPLLVLEAMKMEHEIVAPLDGTVTELPVQVGTQVDAGSLLAAIEGPPEGA